MTLATSSTLVKRQPPLLPQTLPTTQAGWSQFVTQMQEWYQSIQSMQSAPNVLPAQYSVFSQSGVPPLTLVGCSATQDATHTLYGPQSLKVIVSGAPATMTLTGFPIAIQPGQLWYCAFEVYGSNFTGSLALGTSAGTTVLSGIASASTGWNLVWTLLDLTAYQDTQATWVITFTSPGTFWLDGLQMSPAGNPFLQQPPFVVGTGAIPANTTIGSTPAPGSITGSMIAPVTITAVNIAPVTITAAQIAPVAITAAQIAPLTITATQIAPLTITNAQIAGSTITAGQIAANTITAGQIAANTITAGQIQAGTITGNQLAANTISAGNIAANTITSGQIAAGSILANSIASNTITSLQIAANTITGGNIAANTITAGNIAANTITALQIAANTITTNQIAAGTILANNIAANTITSGQIAANSIVASNLSVGALSAISANLGTITAGTIIFNNGVYMRVQGIGFGASGDLLDWYGPSFASIGSCTKANAKFYLGVDGSSYFSGSTGIVSSYAGLSGYFKHPPDSTGRVYIDQWGTWTSVFNQHGNSTWSPNDVTFTLTFPNVCLNAIAIPKDNVQNFNVGTLSRGSFVINFSVASPFQFYWRAFGY